jgi:hypothetical protein
MAMAKEEEKEEESSALVCYGEGRSARSAEPAGVEGDGLGADGATEAHRIQPDIPLLPFVEVAR